MEHRSLCHKSVTGRKPQFVRAGVALGSNLPSVHGDPTATITAALERLNENGLTVVATSPLYSTPCFPARSGPDFVNAAALLKTSLSAEELLVHLHRIEAETGRERKTRWAARPLDLDLLFYGDTISPDREALAEWMDLPVERQRREAPARLILPHPRLHERGFVLVPLNDIAADWRHPITGQTVQQMMQALDPAEIAEIRAL